MVLNISSNLYCTAYASIELPISSWSDVKEWYVKWDYLNYTLDGETWQKVQLESSLDGGVDWKRPSSVTVYTEDFQEELDGHE